MPIYAFKILIGIESAEPTKFQIVYKLNNTLKNINISQSIVFLHKIELYKKILNLKIISSFCFNAIIESRYLLLDTKEIQGTHLYLAIYKLHLISF